MKFDPEKYRHHIDTFDLTEDEKLRFMEQVWSIAQHFVDRAFRLLPEQILLGTEGTKCPKRAYAGLDSDDHLPQTFNDAVQE